MTFSATDVSTLHRTRIEQSLQPEQALRQRNTQPVALVKRMAQCRMPAVSIAVIAEGQIEWARGYEVLVRIML